MTNCCITCGCFGEANPVAFREFERFLASPFYNRRSIYSKLVALYKREVLSNADLTKTIDELRVLFAPKNPPSKGVFSRYRSEARGMMERFLSLHPGPSDIERAVAILQGLIRWGFLKYFGKIYDKAEKVLIELEDRSIQYWQYRYRLLMLRAEAATHDGRILRQKSAPSIAEIYEEAMAANRLDHMMKQLLLCCAHVNAGQMMQVEALPETAQDVLDEIDRRYDEMPYAIRLYYSAFLLIRDKSDAHLDHLVGILKHAHEFDRSSIEDLYRYVLNFYIGNYNRRGTLSDMHNSVRVYRSYLLVVVRDGMVSDADFKNIVSQLAVLGETAEARNFISDYRLRVATKTRHRLVALCTAVVEFFEGNFRACYQILCREEKYWDLFFELDRKMMECRCLYAMEAEDTDFESLSDSSHRNLKRFRAAQKRISQSHALAYKNGIRFLWRLFLLRRNEKRSAKKLAKLIAEMETTESIAGRQWMLQKARELAEKA